MLKQKCLKWVGVVKQVFEVSLTFCSHQRVGVLSLGQEQELGLTPILHGGQGRFEPPEGRLAACVVAVETEHHLGHDAEQPLQMRLAGGRAECGDRVGNAVLSQGDHVHVAFDHDNTLQAPRMLARLPQAIKLTGFLKDRRLGGVQILGLVIAQHAAAEGDDPAALVLYWEHDPLAKAVVRATLVVLDQHT